MWRFIFLVGLLVSIKAQPGITYNVELFVRTPNLVTGMEFAPDGRLFYTEKETGNVRVVDAAGVLQRDPVIHFRVDALGERGLIGIALDPNFSENHFIWVYMTVPKVIDGVYKVWQQVIRFQEENNIGHDPLVLLEVPYESRDYSWHTGGRLRFDEEGYLYVSIGDNANAANAEDLTVYPGKIHRFEVIGDALHIPDDNPWENNSAFAIGLRNPIDFVFDPYSDSIFATENGPSCDDEINLIQAGHHYGWREGYNPISDCDDERPGEHPEYTYPLLHYTPTIAPVGIGVYTGDQIPVFEGNVFFCAWKDGQMRSLTLNSQRDQVVYEEIVDLRGAACHTAVLTGPDGALYFASSSGIYRLVSVD